jgi:hypothetical protein
VSVLGCAHVGATAAAVLAGSARAPCTVAADRRQLACFCEPARSSKCVSPSVFGTHPTIACLLRACLPALLLMCRSTYSKHPHKEPWVLTRVVGEPLSWDPLEAISPEHPPEAIVAAQVQALK